MSSPEILGDMPESQKGVADLAVYLGEAIDQSVRPLIELARDAEEKGLLDQANRLMEESRTAGFEAGLAYLDDVRDEINRLESELRGISVVPYAETWSQMTPEQHMLAGKLSKEIAKNFEQYGVTEDALHVIKVEAKSGEQQFVLVYTGAGIDIGVHTKDSDPARSCSAVMSPENDKLFIIEVDGESYDTRKSMTQATYDALQRYLQDNNLPIPDSEQFSKDTGDVRTYTILTGEPLTAPGLVLVGDGIDRPTLRQIAQYHSGTRDLRVGIAVQIP